MESAKSPLAVALADERLGKGWRRSRKTARTVAVLSALIAAAVLYGLFDSFRVQPGDSKPERQTVASVDLRIGNPAGAAERGEVGRDGREAVRLVEEPGERDARHRPARLSRRGGGW